MVTGQNGHSGHLVTLINVVPNKNVVQDLVITPDLKLQEKIALETARKPHLVVEVIPAFVQKVRLSVGSKGALWCRSW